MDWLVETDWREMTPLLPVFTVEGDVVWFRKCQMRILRSQLSGDRLKQYRSLPLNPTTWRT